ncbi:MAG: 16S rRNA (uracil(1498)-N(3))-methyltransferase [Pseudomonadota bacterium]
MRANYKMQRLFIDGPLLMDGRVTLDNGQTNYLLNVLRMEDGAELLVFNGHDGEWRARLARTGKKTAQLVCDMLERPQTVTQSLIVCFAPLKVGRMDYLVQKAVEMGAGVLQPVLTDFTQNHRLSVDKMRLWTIEAAEQCGVLSIPECRAPLKLHDMLDGWDAEDGLIFCDEDAPTDNPLDALNELEAKRFGLLIGPEGGFSDGEREKLRALPFVTSIPLGPRILRADTAAVAAMAIVQATIGDW